MRTIYSLLITGYCFCNSPVFAQAILPDFTVKNNKGKISVSWQNKYLKEVKGISLQRSFDSSKNFSSITTMPDPTDFVHGYLDAKVPYPKMFYRLFIVFDSGIYLFTESKRPDPDSAFNLTNALKKIRAENSIKKPVVKEPVKPIKKAGSSKKIKPKQDKPIVKTITPPVLQPQEVAAEPIPKKEEPPFPSKRIYTGKDNNLVINLPDFKLTNYTVKFYSEAHQFIFELNKINEDFLTIEKVNFLHAGWFFFEIYEHSQLLEKNKFFIPKD